MEERASYSARAFCQHHRIEITFIRSLQDYGLITAEEADDDLLLSAAQLEALERLVRLHYGLQINLEGIDAIYHLLDRVESLQQEVSYLKARLRFHEEKI
ncbi:MAG: MerR family transcriptional regulator [Chitinophagaceae bacterium]|nr:MAG: MerR family transcriptional regulator [Chitinophagaceae bacterium]